MSGQDQKSKKVVVSRSNLTTCPSCMAHITLASSLEETSCPFCEANLVTARASEGAVFGRNAMRSLKKSRSAMLAAALGASLSMAACGDNSSSDPVALYGAPVIEDMAATDDGNDGGEEDMFEPVAMYGAPPVEDMDIKDMSDMSEPVAMYGAPPSEEMG